MSRVILIKLHPNEELYHGIESACRLKKVSGGLVLSSAGSLNDAWLWVPSPDGPRGQLCVRGPGLEIAGLSGEVVVDSNDGAASVLNGWVTREDTSVTGGELIRGKNIVCITYEILVQEWSS